MGQNISALRGIVSNIQRICNSLRSLVSADLMRQGLAIIAKIKDFIAAFPWCYSAAFTVGAFIYFLPKMLNMFADWMRELWSAWDNLKSAWRGEPKPGSSGSDPGAKVSQLEKRIEELETENMKMEKLLEENRIYAIKHSIRPVNVFIQNNYYNTDTDKRTETRKSTNRNENENENVLCNL